MGVEYGILIVMTEELTLIGVLALGIFLGLLLYQAAWLVVRGRRAVQAGKQAVPASQVSTREQARVLIIGDSTAYGTGASQAEYSLAGRLAHDFPQFTIINAAENAMSIAQLEQKVAALKDQHQQFDVVMIHLGGMDTISFTRLKQIKTKLNAIFAETKHLGARLTVLVSVNNVGAAPFFQFPLDRLYTHRSRQVSAACNAACAEAKALHVPLFVERSDDPLFVKSGPLFAPDGIHPNDDGYAMWYQKIKTTIEPHVVSWHT